MALIGSLSVSSIEEAFGLKPGDLKLVSDTTASAPFLAKNAWSHIESTPLRVTRLEVIKGTCMNRFASITANTVGPVFEFAKGGTSYDEYLIHNIMRLYNVQIHYEVVAYVNEKCRLVHPSSTSCGLALFPGYNATVEKMTDLILVTLSNEECKEGEIGVFQADGPNQGEYEDYKMHGNWGKCLFAIRKIDMDGEVTSCSPEWLRQRKEQLNAKN